MQALKLGESEVFRVKGILAALLYSSVCYVGGYQGAPVSHLLDVLVEAEDILAEFGVHAEACTNAGRHWPTPEGEGLGKCIAEFEARAPLLQAAE